MATNPTLPSPTLGSGWLQGYYEVGYYNLSGYNDAWQISRPQGIALALHW
jgi:hypothetical protein